MDEVRQKGVIAWFATNPVAANLLRKIPLYQASWTTLTTPDLSQSMS